MRKLLLLFCFGLLASLTWGQSINGNITAASSTCGTNNSSNTTACVVLKLDTNSGTATIDLIDNAGTYVGTVQFEVSFTGGASWRAKTCYPTNSTSGVSSATAVGGWTCPAMGGATHLRVRESAAITGSVNVTITRSAASASLGTGGGGGGTTSSALTINNGGSGDASGSTFNGSSPITVSYNSIGAVPTTRTVAGKALSGNITLAQTDLTAGNYTIGAYYIDQAEIAAPANPAAGSCRQYVDSTTHKVTFLNSAGASCISAGSGTVTASGTPLIHQVPIWTTATDIKGLANGTTGQFLGANTGADPSWQTPAGSGTVTVVGAGSLTSTALMTGGGTTTAQTPSATSTLDSSGNAVFAGSVSAAGAVTSGTTPTGIAAGALGGFGSTEATSTGWTPSATTDYCRADSTAHRYLCSMNGGSELNMLTSAGLAAIASGKTLTVSNSMTQTATDGSTVAFGTGGTVLYSGARRWSCQPGIGDGTNAVTAATYLESICYNDTGSTVTLTGLKCFTDNSGSSTMNAAGNTLGALLTGAVTCSTAFAAGTQSANVALTAGDYIKFTWVLDGTSKQLTTVVSGTY